ncbi:hypothetical protein REPUB_Repub09cG0174300 [Reevesia pubescens]
MAAMTQNCRISEKHKYWEEFESNRHQIFKVLIGGFRNYLRIPKKFMSNFRENLSGTIHLRGPSGFMWTVKLGRMFDQVVLLNGWENFVKDHSLAEADFLVFRYDGNSTFNVIIFDRSGCEREGSYFVKKHTNACSNDRCLLQKEEEEDYEVIDLDKIHENHMQKEINKGRGRPSSTAVSTSYNRCKSKVTEKKQPQVIKSAVPRERVEVLMDESDEASESAKEANEDWGNESVSLKCESKRQEGKMKKPVDLPGTYCVHFMSNRRGITEEEKQRPCKLARQYSSTRPSFTVVMKPSHVCRAFKVSIPKKWRAMHILDDVRRAVLRVPPGEKIWPVRIGCKEKNKFTVGWDKFVMDNNLEENDACVFELNDGSNANGKIIIFNVIIFRVLDEIVPLTKFSRAKPKSSGYRDVTA